MPLTTTIITFVIYALGVYAVPSPRRLESRAVDATTFTALSHMEQFAAAAYCPGNNNSPNTKLSCAPADTCPLVEAANTNTLFEFENSLITDVTGYVATDTTNSLVVVSFRGSQSVRNWISNLNFLLVPTDLCATCFAHDGFWTSWAEARSGVLAAIMTAANSHPGFQLVVTGHSLGGAIATLAAAELRKKGYTAQLYTYGAPRIGNKGISNFITTQGGNFRVTHKNDPVPKLPPRLGYVHIAPEYYITSANNVTVTPSDIQVFQTGDSSSGNAGDGGLDTDAHGWYFNRISACSDGDFELKKRDEEKR
ncbi:putative extracellular lipase [Pseudovirgaria hyperparasitica]|uniref:Extracellular lipase n=1 Tax=Pseudovirgaria hyperparasitica TaxID=470096 RepID=A0A6A6W818_9PEZI|nr:putative extracellular lipase [Pseudovirgaria hyperparasitica]KAF2758349.1 putative extracellular lipase [Pseudovirgaria hyperparasitica]